MLHTPARALCRLAAGFAIFSAVTGLASGAAQAKDAPFQLNPDQWASFAPYQGSDKAEAPASAADPADTSPSAMPAVAAPHRPIALPVMPGMDKNVDMRVDSTADDASASPVPVVTSNAIPDIHLSNQNWQPLSTQKKRAPTADDDDSQDDSANALGVRMSFLPSPQNAPVPSPDHASAQKLGDAILERRMAAKSASGAQEKAAVCSAIDRYNKQQLDAIERDRQTLKALQDAIGSLGLQKKLSFMTENNSALVNTPNDAISTGINAPTSRQ